jgi:hypothetical protein
MQTWESQVSVDDLKIAADIKAWADQYRPRLVCFDKYTTQSIADRLANAGVMVEDVSGQNVAYIAHVDNTVYPMTGDEIAAIIQKHGVKMKWMGDAKFGKVWDDERTKYYEFKISGPTGEVDSLVDELSQENGIDFVPTAKLGESHDETDMKNPEEKREVELAKKAKEAADAILKMHGK